MKSRSNLSGISNRNILLLSRFSQDGICVGLLRLSKVCTTRTKVADLNAALGFSDVQCKPADHHIVKVTVSLCIALGSDAYNSHILKLLVHWLIRKLNISSETKGHKHKDQSIRCKPPVEVNGGRSPSTSSRTRLRDQKTGVRPNM
jgi:hypothetical protein